MIRINENYEKLHASYLFAEIAKREKAFVAKNPHKKIIKMGIGDVTLPLPKACISAFHAAVDEMADARTFRGYGPDQGYDFLRTAIAQHDYIARNVDITADEIFISDGAKCDTANIQEIFDSAITIALPDPVYPVYVDSNVMAGRSGGYSNGRYSGFIYLDCTESNGYVPTVPENSSIDLIYLCFPNNPTGATATRQQLQVWVDYARKNRALILYDSAYVAFIRDPALPHTIYEIDGAKEVAIEFRSFSKTAGFTGTRCAYTVVPKECHGFDSTGKPIALHKLWLRRFTTKFNGVSYPVQRAAEAVYSAQGTIETRQTADYYLRNAGCIIQSLATLGYRCVGGINAPYIWFNAKMDSWKFFEMLLEKAAVVCTPGIGFGANGDGYIRLTAFNGFENVQEAMQRISQALA
ncbi:MAG: LL-diaminopimelate aminotransferase [Chitinivibrionales bacterium]|nr:LL-diaminopimelate aminotransferase [Chitinivibrionales bacterium]